MVGLISDTHGLLRPEAVDALRGSDLIVHAGDVGDPSILHALGKLAPVRAVRGNVDGGPLAALPATEVVEVEGLHLYVLHDRDTLDLDPGAAGFAAVVYGHSHRPLVEERDGVLWINPGSAGPRRFSLPITVARLHVEDGRLRVERVDLDRTLPLG